MYRTRQRFSFVLCLAALAPFAFTPQAMARGGGHGGGRRAGGGHHAGGHRAAGGHAGNHPGNHARAHHGAHDLSHNGYHHGGYARHGGWGGYGGYGYGWGHRGWGGYGLAAGIGYGLGYWGAAPVGYPATSAYAVPVPAYSTTEDSADDLAADQDDSQSDGDTEANTDAAVSAGPVDPAQTDSGDEPNEDENAVIGDHSRTDNRAAIHVVVPDANATIQFNGEKMVGKGRDRMILTPVIEPGQEFRFQIKATWTNQGKEIRETRSGRTTAGAQVRADFTQPAGEHNPTSLVPTKRQVVPEDSTSDDQATGESKPAPEDFVPASAPATESAQ